MDKFGIDSHKLVYHVERLGDWMRGKEIAPVYLEISPSGVCNHRCVFCAYDYVSYNHGFIDAAMLKKRLSEMGRCGVRSILYSGEGEPFLHKEITDIFLHTKKSGIDAAVATNAVLFGKDKFDATLGSLSWLKVSINAGKKETYAAIHRTKSDDFDTVMRNMEAAAAHRRRKGYGCTLGMQMLLLPENYREAALLAERARAIGMDYLVIKPYSHHHFSKTTQYKNIKYKDYLYLAEDLAAFNTDRFNVVFRAKTMKKWDEARRPYRHCLALDFWAHIDTLGNVWGCPAYLSDKRFLYGSIYTQTFRQIWQGGKKKKMCAYAASRLDISQCRCNCRMDEVNRFLWSLKHPPEHVNFI